MKKFILALGALLLPVMAAAQISLSGKVQDQQTGEALPGASIRIENTTFSTVTDAKGMYSFNNLKPGAYLLETSFIGYQSNTATVTLTGSFYLSIGLSRSNQITDEVTVNATRATANAATTFTNLSKKDLAKNNLGQDIPYLLDQTPSTVITSDGGTGIGYTGIHIRGSDETRTNVTLNGIPLNDAEDQGVYFVDLPDLVSSVDNIQIQRGVGTSTNGAGAFGASINIQTTTRRDTGYLELDNSAGSFGTIKNTVGMGTGLIDGKFSFDGRLSRIESNGYIDRAFSHLKSYFLSGAYYGKHTLIRLNVFSGYEQTYQAWDGVPQDSLATNRTYNELGLEPNGTYYNNQTDNYTQNYAQLLLNQQITEHWSFNGALHYTKGFGYYEVYAPAQAVANYGLTPVVIGGTSIDTTDMVQRLWLNNDFYGVTYALNYNAEKDFNFTLGGAYNQYKGAHYNNIEWTQQSTNATPDYEYSRDNAQKNDFNVFAKADYTFDNVTLFADMQYRHISYSFLGFDEHLNNVQQAVTLNFFNPKGGITYQLNANSNIYASIAVGNHEPNRSDYTESSPASRPKPETLYDYELGYRLTTPVFSGSINAFYMDYKNQLVLTGALDDVGEQIRTNVDKSYRAGLEFDGHLRINKAVTWSATAALSANKVQNFNQYLFSYPDPNNYNNYLIVHNQYQSTDIAFSPDFIASSEIAYSPIKGGEVAFISKFVGKQYLDNTQNDTRALDAYLVNHVRLRYSFATKAIKNIGFTLLVNNVFSKLYSSNGATYPEIDGGVLNNYNYYYPQAPRNFLASVNLSF